MPSLAAPNHLSPATKRHWTKVCEYYSLEIHHKDLLQLWCEGLDMKQSALEQLKKDGLTISGREGLRQHPCVAIARDASKQIANAIKQLGLDRIDEPPKAMGRPPATSKYGDYAGGNGKHAG